MGGRELNQRSFRVKVNVVGDRLVVYNHRCLKQMVKYETPDSDYLLVITEDPEGPFNVVTSGEVGCKGVKKITSLYETTCMCFLPDYFVGKRIRREVILILPEQKFHWIDFAHITPP